MAAIEIPFAQAADIIRAAFPGANSKRTVKVEIREEYRVADFWQDGSRDECAFVKLDTLQSVPSSALPQEARQVNGNPFNLPIGTVQIAIGFCVVEHVYFRGKDLGYRIYLRAENMTPALQAAPAPDLDARDRRILAAFRGLKSGPYRQSTLENLKFSEDDRARLASGGYLKVASNGATAITVEGRAACADER